MRDASKKKKKKKTTTHPLLSSRQRDAADGESRHGNVRDHVRAEIRDYETITKQNSFSQQPSLSLSCSLHLSRLPYYTHVIDLYATVTFETRVKYI